MMTLARIAAYEYIDREAEPIDDSTAFELAWIVANYFFERPQKVKRLPANERAALDRLWAAEEAWRERGVDVDEAGNLLPEFAAAIDAQDAVGQIIRATFPPPRADDALGEGDYP